MRNQEPIAEDRFFETVRDAARFLLALQSAQHDLAAPKTFYAIDTNIIILFLFPSAVPGTVERFSRFFNDDPPELLGALADRVTREILFGERYRDALVLPEPYHEEADWRIGGYIAHESEQILKAESEVRSIPTAVREAQQRLAEKPPAEAAGDLLELIRAEAPALYHFLVSDRQGVLDRMRSYNAEELPGRNANSIPVLHGTRLAEVPNDPRNPLYIEAAQWYDRLHAEKAESASSQNIKTDADVLAWLVAVNRHFLDQGGHHRLQLITGDDAMRRAFDQWYYGGGAQDGLSHLLRHPREIARVVLSAASGQHATRPAPALSPQEAEPLERFLNLLLAGLGATERRRDIAKLAWARDRRALPAALRDRLDKLSRRFSHVGLPEVDQIKREWRQTLHLALFGEPKILAVGAEGWPVSSRPTGSTISVATQRLERVLSEESFQSALADEIETTLQDLLTIYSQLSVADDELLLLLRLRREEMRPGVERNRRRIPWYPSAGGPHAREYLDLLRGSLNAQTISRIQATGKQLTGGERKLAHAYMRALCGEVAESQELCLSLCEAGEPTVAAEALLLRAVLLRLDARSPQKAAECLMVLEKAAAAFRHLGREREPRLLSERSAASLQLLDLWHMQGQASEPMPTPLVSAAEALIALQEVISTLQDGQAKLDPPEARERVLMQAITNLCGGSVSDFLGWYGDEPAVSRLEHEVSLRRLEAWVGPDEGEAANYVRFVLAAGRWRLAFEGGDQASCARALESLRGCIAEARDPAPGQDQVAAIVTNDLQEMEATLRSIEGRTRPPAAGGAAAGTA